MYWTPDTERNHSAGQETIKNCNHVPRADKLNIATLYNYMASLPCGNRALYKAEIRGDITIRESEGSFISLVLLESGWRHSSGGGR
jgi:hypothetical protein